MANKELSKMKRDLRLESGKLMTQRQLDMCNGIIHTASTASAAAGAIPIPIADAIPITAAQITMVIALGNVFEVKLTKTAARTALTGVAAPIIGRTIASSFLKFIPIVGWAASAALAALITEVIGWSIANDFAIEFRREYELRKKTEKHNQINDELDKNEILHDTDDEEEAVLSISSSKEYMR
jgi:uncharacterized protein (DUF697 family)